jgi:hypothetical protein
MVAVATNDGSPHHPQWFQSRRDASARVETNEGRWTWGLGPPPEMNAHCCGSSLAIYPNYERDRLRTELSTAMVISNGGQTSDRSISLGLSFCETRGAARLPRPRVGTRIWLIGPGETRRAGGDRPGCITHLDDVCVTRGTLTRVAAFCAAVLTAPIRRVWRSRRRFLRDRARDRPQFGRCRYR